MEWTDGESQRDRWGTPAEAQKDLNQTCWHDVTVEMDPRASLINSGATWPLLICLTNASHQRARQSRIRTGSKLGPFYVKYMWKKGQLLRNND